MNNYGRKSIDLRLTNSEYYDFYLTNAVSLYRCCDSTPTSGECFVVWYDFSNTETFKKFRSNDKSARK